MERIIGCYVASSRVALEAIDCADPDSWRPLHALLPKLREHISCGVCRKLADRPGPHADGFACPECAAYEASGDATYEIVQCYRELCALVYKSPIYDVMCSRHEDAVLVELITEAIGVPRPINGRNGLPNGGVPGAVVKQEAKEMNNHNDVGPDSSLDVKLPIKNSTTNECTTSQMMDAQSLKHRTKHQPVLNNTSKKKRNERRGCRCGNATTTPGKLTCFGQRCPCYTEQKPCDRCKCRGCRNPRQKLSNSDDHLESDQMRRKPVTIELVSSLQPSHIIESKPTYGSYIMHDALQFPSHIQNYEQSGTEVTLGPVNSIFRSP